MGRERRQIKPSSTAWDNHGGWLYAFVVDGEVKYVGLANRVLRSRLDEYTHMKNSQTVRLRGLIAVELAAGRPVQIYGWKQSNKAMLFAEEERLRGKYRPPWNRV